MRSSFKLSDSILELDLEIIIAARRTLQQAEWRPKVVSVSRLDAIEKCGSIAFRAGKMRMESRWHMHAISTAGPPVLRECENNRGLLHG